MPKINLSKPAFGQNAQKVSELDSEETNIVEKAEEVKPEVEEIEEESKVPYSRFKKFHDAAKEAEEQAAYWKAKATAIENEPKPFSYNEELPQEWVELYGDSETSKKAWKVQQNLFHKAEQRAEQKALEAVQNERYEEMQRTEENVEVIDSNFEDLSALVGRDLTDKEQDSILDIVDDYTPKDRNGNYAGSILPFEKAWEIYELKNQGSKVSKIQSRNQVAALSGSQSQGEPSADKAEQNKNWNPLNWNAYKDRI